MTVKVWDTPAVVGEGNPVTVKPEVVPGTTVIVLEIPLTGPWAAEIVVDWASGSVTGAVPTPAEKLTVAG